MLKEGDRIMYGKVSGEVIKPMCEISLVKLEDGKEYSIENDQLIKMESKSFSIQELKNLDSLRIFASDLDKAGVSELTIKNGEIVSFRAKESLEEKKRKRRETILKASEDKIKEALEKADKEAEEEFKRETSED